MEGQAPYTPVRPQIETSPSCFTPFFLRAQCILAQEMTLRRKLTPPLSMTDTPYTPVSTIPMTAIGESAPI